MSKKHKHSHTTHAQDIANKAGHYAQQAVDGFSRFPMDRRIAYVFLGVLSFVILLFPLVQFVAIDTQTTSVMRLFSRSFFQSSILIVLIMVVLRGWYAIPRFKQLIHMTLGFKDNDYLFTFFLLFVWFGMMIAMQESISFATAVTTTVSMTTGYYIVVFLLLAGLIYSLIKLLDEAKVLRKTSFINMMKPTKQNNSDDVSRLFSDEDIH